MGRVAEDPAGWKRLLRRPEGESLEDPDWACWSMNPRSLKTNFPDDEERPPVPHWIPEGETHQDNILGERGKKYPLLCQSNHGRWRVHAEHDDIPWLREIPTCKIKGIDGYMYEPIWIHPIEAKKRGIKQGDIIGMYNERGMVLGGAYVTERIIPGAALPGPRRKSGSSSIRKVRRAVTSIAAAPTTSSARRKSSRGTAAVRLAAASWLRSRRLTSLS